jgi:vacuolar-type H+-ATPase subunit I/STV1
MYATIFHWLSQLSAWLEKTALSQAIQFHDWIVPAVQSIHILAIAMVIGSALMINLRLVGLYAPDRPPGEVIDRFIPAIWWSLIALLLTGIVMIVAEPPRSLKNPVFQLKMVLLAAALAVTAICHVVFGRNRSVDEPARGRRAGAAALAGFSTLLWVGVVFAGRWIAYYY